MIDRKPVIRCISGWALPVLAVLFLIGCTASTQEPKEPADPSVLPTYAQKTLLNSILTDFLQKVDTRRWAQEARCFDAAIAAGGGTLPWHDGATLEFESEGSPCTYQLSAQEGPDKWLCNNTYLPLPYHARMELRKDQLLVASLEMDAQPQNPNETDAIKEVVTLQIGINLQHYRIRIDALLQDEASGTFSFTNESEELIHGSFRTEGLSIVRTDEEIFEAYMGETLHFNRIEAGATLVHLESDMLGRLQLSGSYRQSEISAIMDRFDALTPEDKANDWITQAEACLSIGLYYPGNETRQALLGYLPLHRNTHGDNYWTWIPALHFPDSDMPIRQLFNDPVYFDDFTQAFSLWRVQAVSLLPHILR